MKHSTLLKDGYIVLPDKTVKGSIRIRGEVIDALGDIVPLEHEEIIDCSGCYFLPGGIETHTHLDLESMGTVTADDFKSGTLAALAGGTTTVIDFATQFHGESMARGLERWHEKADGRSAIDYGFHMAMTEWNDALRSEMASIVEGGITSFKMYMAYKGRMMVQEDGIYEALEEAGKLGATIGFHCENGLLIDLFTRRIREAGNLSPYYHQMTRPSELEAEAIDRLETVVQLLHTNHYVVHLSTARGLSSILRARERGNHVVVETCPQYLVLDRSRYGTPEDDDFEAAKFIMSPPLRERRDQEALWQGLASGEIQFVGTDHCSFNFKGQKEMGRDDFSKIPNGAPGIELRMNLMYSHGVSEGRMDINRFSVVTSTNAAKYFGLFPKKGILRAGSDADIVVFDPKAEWTVTSDLLHENCDYTPYEGFALKGKVRDVFLRGNRKVESGVLVVKDADGQYLKRDLPITAIR
ncbi:MAG TPA: dihydropyrimidinase [Clostridiaceae bacterium]|jgi:dihydropyrimidinase|nr:dihydropyrimidinase [Clostridiaceae bacterium]